VSGKLHLVCRTYRRCRYAVFIVHFPYRTVPRSSTKTHRWGGSPRALAVEKAALLRTDQPSIGSDSELPTLFLNMAVAMAAAPNRKRNVMEMK
jgi:hypothetical protein